MPRVWRAGWTYLGLSAIAASLSLIGACGGNAAVDSPSPNDAAVTDVIRGDSTPHDAAADLSDAASDRTVDALLDSVADAGADVSAMDDASEADVASDVAPLDGPADAAVESAADATPTDGSAEGGVAATAAVSIIVEPSDNAAALLSAIQNATTSLHVAMYVLSNTTVVTRLISKHTAGLDVKVLLDTAANSAVYTQLQGAGVNVHWAPSTFTFAREKCVIVDGTAAWVMTMDATPTAATDNREYLAIDTDAADVSEAEAIFAADFADQTFTPAGGSLVVGPENARDKLTALIDGAMTSIDIEAQQIGDAEIAYALGGALGRGVSVRVVLPSGAGSPAQQSAIAGLTMNGGKVVSVATPSIHANSIVADGTIAFVGSEPFDGSLGSSRDLGVITNAPSEVAKVAAATNTDFGNGTPF